MLIPFTGGLKDGTPGKGGSVYGRFSGMCFETQFCPDSPNRPEFPSCVLREGEEYRHTTALSFEVDRSIINSRQ